MTVQTMLRSRLGVDLDGLLDLIERGWPMFPQYGVADDGGCACRLGSECESPGKHPIPSNGRDAATCESTAIIDWYEAHPRCNWAVVTGRASGVVAIDVDGPEGADSIGRLLLEHARLTEDPSYPDGVAARSGRGHHLYMRLPAGCEIPSSVARLGPGLEVKAERANLTLPGSRHHSGVFYEWLDALPRGPLPEPCAWLLKMMLPPPAAPRSAPLPPPTDPDRAQRYGLAGLQAELDELAATEPGGRNHRLNAAAFAVSQLVAGGCLDYDYAVGELARVGIEIRLPVGEIEATIRSGISAGAKTPRSAAA